jgi:hypothetical protein
VPHFSQTAKQTAKEILGRPRMRRKEQFVWFQSGSLHFKENEEEMGQQGGEERVR